MKTGSARTSAACIVPRVSFGPLDGWCRANRYALLVKTPCHKAEAGAQKAERRRSGPDARHIWRKTRPRSAGSQQPSVCCCPMGSRRARIAPSAGRSPQSRPPLGIGRRWTSVARHSGAGLEAGGRQRPAMKRTTQVNRFHGRTRDVCGEKCEANSVKIMGNAPSVVGRQLWCVFAVCWARS